MAGYIIYSLDWSKFQQMVDKPTKAQVAALADLLRDGLEENDGEFDESDPVGDWPADAKALAPIVTQRLALPDWYGDLSRGGKALWEGVVFRASMNNDAIDLGFRVDSDGVYWDVIELAWKRLGVVPNTITDVALSAFGVRPYRYQPRPGPGKSRADYEQDKDAQRASLDAMSKLLGQFVEDAKSGKKDPNTLLEALEQSDDVSRGDKAMLKGLLSDDDSDDDEEDEAQEWTPMHSMHTPQEVEKMRAELQSVEPALKAAKNKDARRDYTEELMPAIESVASEGRMLFIQVDT